jgi:hypothetical protein
MLDEAGCRSGLVLGEIKYLLGHIEGLNYARCFWCDFQMRGDSEKRGSSHGEWLCNISQRLRIWVIARDSMLIFRGLGYLAIKHHLGAKNRRVSLFIG